LAIKEAIYKKKIINMIYSVSMFTVLIKLAKITALG
jgi:hypothetical protein